MKDLLALLGLIFLALLAALGLLLVSTFFNMTGTVPITINGTPLSPPDLRALATLTSGEIRIERTNPLEDRPLPDLFPTALPALFPERTPGPTPTPPPPLDPLIFRTEVTIRARNFAAALDAFLEANARLAQDESLLGDPAWRAEMNGILEQVSLSGKALGEVGPAPAEYAAIDALLKRVGGEAEGLHDNYLHALETGDGQGFTAASDNFARIKEYLVAAFDEMSRAGWPVE